MLYFFDPYIFDTVPSRKHVALATATSELCEYLILYPVDVVKTRMQMLMPTSKAKYAGVISGFRTIAANEGLKRFYRGMSLPLLAAIPAHFSYYFAYVFTAKILMSEEAVKASPLEYAGNASVAITARNIVMNPADVVKQRIQVYDSPYTSGIRCLMSVKRSEGIIALYRSLPTQIAIDAPNALLCFLIYESFQNYVNPSRDFKLWSIIACGALSSGIAAAITNPLDVCKTLLNTQETSTIGVIKSRRVRGLSQAFKTLWHLHGVRGLDRGISARVMHRTPSGALAWVMTEFLSHFYAEKVKLY